MNKKLSLLALTLAFCLASVSGVALAAKPIDAGNGNGHGGGGGAGGHSGGGKAIDLGYDVSWPQCDSQLPTGAFMVVGVNGPDANQHNPCLAEQFAWAQQSTGTTNQAKAQLYVNTANPGQVQDQMTSEWPSDNSFSGLAPNPYGTCSGANDAACSYEYGWGRADFSLNYFAQKTNAVAGDYMWWLDIETMNSWQSGSDQAYANNVATLEGEVAAFRAAGVQQIGLYSTAAQWAEITDNQLGLGTLNGLDNWRPGGASLHTAMQACSAAPLTPNGRVVMTQFESKGLDNDYSCIN